MSQKHVHTFKDDERTVVGKYLTPFQRKLLQKSCQQEITDKESQRIQIMLLADEGQTQTQICQELGCCQATARHWIAQARNNQAHNWKSNPIGRPTLVDEQYKERLKILVNKSPKEVNVPNREYQYPFKRWTAKKLSQHLDAELGIKVTPQHLNRLLKEMGLSTRPSPNCLTESKPCRESEPEGSTKSIQISDLDSVSISEASEIWNFNPLTSN